MVLFPIGQMGVLAETQSLPWLRMTSPAGGIFWLVQWEDGETPCSSFMQMGWTKKLTDQLTQTNPEQAH